MTRKYKLYHIISQTFVFKSNSFRQVLNTFVLVKYMTHIFVMYRTFQMKRIYKQCSLKNYSSFILILYTSTRYFKQKIKMLTSLKVSGFILIGLYCLCLCEAQSHRVNLLNLPSKIELKIHFNLF